LQGRTSAAAFVLQQTAILSANYPGCDRAEVTLEPASNGKTSARINRKAQRRDIMNRKTSAIVAISLACSVLAAPPARAQVFDLATGIAGDLVDGVLSGGAAAANAVVPVPMYHASQLPPPPSELYAEEEQPPVCRIRRVRAWNGYGWVFRRIEVCG
jgi:hypothetical protein